MLDPDSLNAASVVVERFLFSSVGVDLEAAHV